MSWSSQKKKEGIFCIVYFVQRNFFNIYVLSQCILYCIHFQNICTFTNQKTLFHIILLLVFKIVESLQYILKRQRNIFLKKDSQKIQIHTWKGERLSSHSAFTEFKGGLSGQMTWHFSILQGYFLLKISTYPIFVFV